MEENLPLQFDVIGIQKCQQNRYPLLFIDEISQAIPGKFARGKKNFTYNEWFFPAHFENDPNVPGFIQIECLVQTFIMTFLCIDQYKGKKTNFIGINDVTFKKKIIPGDTLIIEATLDSLKRGIAKGSAISYVKNKQACSANFIVSIPDIFNKFIPSSTKAS